MFFWCLYANSKSTMPAQLYSLVTVIIRLFPERRAPFLLASANAVAA